MQVVHCFALATSLALLVTTSPVPYEQVYTLNDKPSHLPSNSLSNSESILNLAEESNGSHVPNDENIPLIVFEASIGNRTEVDDCYSSDCGDRDLEVDIIDSNEFESLQQQTEPSHDQNAAQIQLKSTNGDSDTIFFISNTEVKLLDINPTDSLKHQQREVPSIYENFAIDVAENLTLADLSAAAEELKEERGGNFINTPIVHFINKMNRHNFTVQIDPKNDTAPNNGTQQGVHEMSANITSLTVIDGAEPENFFSGLSDFQTITVAGLMTLVPLILATIFIIGVGFGCRILWQKYKQEYDSGSVLLGECNSDGQPAKLAEQGGPLDRKMSNNMSLDGSTGSKLSVEPAEEKGVYRNGSIIKMTMQNNHLIVETEERNDISTDVRETKLHYSSEKDGIFVVESTCGANQMNGSMNKKTNNLIKASQQSVLESNLRLNSDSNDNVKVYSTPNTPPHPKTGLSQSTTSLHSSSTDSNHNYHYGGQRFYQIMEEFKHQKCIPMEDVLLVAPLGGSRRQSSDTVYSSSGLSDKSSNLAVVSEK